MRDGIVDILTPETPQTFTVDNTVNTIGVSAGPGILSNMVNGSGNGLFTNRDNFNILTVGVSLPYCFSFSTGPAKVQFRWRQAANTSPIGPISSRISIPIPDAEIPYGLWGPFSFPPPMDQNAAAYFCLYRLDISISMVGVPDELNGEALPIIPFLKIHHTRLLGA